MVQRVFILSLLLASGVHAARTPADYLVFAIDRSDAVTLVSSEPVELAGDLAPAVDTAFAPRRDRVDVVLLDADGRATFESFVLGDAYTNDDRATFDADVERVSSQFFSMEP